MPRSALDGLISRAQELGAKGLVWAFREGDGWRSPTAKFLSAAELAALNERLGAEEGDLLLVVADKPRVANAVLGQLRLDLAERVRPDPRGQRRPALDRRLAADGVERGGSAGTRCTTLHRARRATSTPTTRAAARALAYDVVWNGQEMGGGSVRISDAERAGARSSPPSGSTPRRRRRASASCSRRCATAPRRTAASPTGSTGSSSASPAPTRSAT